MSSSPLVSRRAPPSPPPPGNDDMAASRGADLGRAVSSTSPVPDSPMSPVGNGPATNEELLQIEAEMRELEARFGVKIPDIAASPEPAAAEAIAAGVAHEEENLDPLPGHSALEDAAGCKAKFAGQRPPPITLPPSTVGDSDDGSCSSAAVSHVGGSQHSMRTGHGSNVAILPGVYEGDVLQEGCGVGPGMTVSEPACVGPIAGFARSDASHEDCDADIAQTEAEPAPMGTVSCGIADLLQQVEADMKKLEADMGAPLIKKTAASGVSVDVVPDFTALTQEDNTVVELVPDFTALTQEDNTVVDLVPDFTALTQEGNIELPIEKTPKFVEESCRMDSLGPGYPDLAVPSPMLSSKMLHRDVAHAAYDVADCRAGSHGICMDTPMGSEGDLNAAEESDSPMGSECDLDAAAVDEESACELAEVVLPSARCAAIAKDSMQGMVASISGADLVAQQQSQVTGDCASLAEPSRTSPELHVQHEDGSPSRLYEFDIEDYKYKDIVENYQCQADCESPSQVVNSSCTPPVQASAVAQLHDVVGSPSQGLADLVAKHGSPSHRHADPVAEMQCQTPSDSPAKASHTSPGDSLAQARSPVSAAPKEQCGDVPMPGYADQLQPLPIMHECIAEEHHLAAEEIFSPKDLQDFVAGDILRGILGDADMQEPLRDEAALAPLDCPSAAGVQGVHATDEEAAPCLTEEELGVRLHQRAADEHDVNICRDALEDERLAAPTEPELGCGWYPSAGKEEDDVNICSDASVHEQRAVLTEVPLGFGLYTSAADERDFNMEYEQRQAPTEIPRAHVITSATEPAPFFTDEDLGFAALPSDAAQDAAAGDGQQEGATEAPRSHVGTSAAEPSPFFTNEELGFGMHPNAEDQEEYEQLEQARRDTYLGVDVDEMAALEAELRELESKMPGVGIVAVDSDHQLVEASAVADTQDVINVLQEVYTPVHRASPALHEGYSGASPGLRSARRSPVSEANPKQEHWSVVLARQRKQAGLDKTAEAFSPQAAQEMMDPSPPQEAGLSNDEPRTNAGNLRQEQPDSFLNQVVSAAVPEFTPAEDMENRMTAPVEDGAAAKSPPRRSSKGKKKAPPALQGPLFGEPEAPAAASASTEKIKKKTRPPQALQAPPSIQPGTASTEAPSGPAVSSSSTPPASETVAGSLLQAVEAVEANVDPVLMGRGLYGNISLQTQEAEREEQRKLQQKQLEKQERQARKRRIEADKRQERLERLGVPPRAPPLARFAPPAAPAPLPESSLPRIPERSQSLPRLKASERPAPRMFQGVEMPSVVPTRDVAPASRLPPLSKAGRRMVPSASEPVLATSVPSPVASNRLSSKFDEIEKQKRRLAGKMEVFQAAQQQLNNVGNLSAVELRGLLQRLHGDPLASNAAADAGEDDRVVRKRMRQVDKYCKALLG